MVHSPVSQELVEQQSLGTWSPSNFVTVQTLSTVSILQLVARRRTAFQDLSPCETQCSTDKLPTDILLPCSLQNDLCTYSFHCLGNDGTVVK